MDIVGNKLVVGLAGRLVHIYDVRKLDTPLQIRESSLKYMTRAIACMGDGQGYACASIEGRVSVEYFDPAPEVQSRRYAFKCHRRPSPTEKDVDQVWSVNALVFHPIYGTFASGGSDGTVCFWDHTAKKRLRQTPRYREAVSALAFNSTGTKLAVGVGYMWDEGEEGGKRSRPGVVIREVGNEVKVRLACLVMRLGLGSPAVGKIATVSIDGTVRLICSSVYFPCGVGSLSIIFGISWQNGRPTRVGGG